MNESLETGVQENPESKDFREEEFLKARPHAGCAEIKILESVRFTRNILDFHKAQKNVESTDSLETDRVLPTTVGSNWIQSRWMFPSTFLNCGNYAKRG